MRTEAQLKQLAEARTHIVRKPMSEETKKKISIANSQDFFAICDYCGKEYKTRKSHYLRNKRHFCCRACYSKYREEFIPKEEHYAYGTGYSIEEKNKRIKARTIFNHYLRDKHIDRQPCEICGGKAEAHHDNYDEPLNVRWLCFKHHRECHKLNKNPDLLEKKMSKVVNNKIQANSLADNKIQAKTPEVGDVWEEPFSQTRFKIYEVIDYDKCSLVYYYHLNLYDTLIRDACELNFFMQRGYKYIGKSKANLSDLFKTENE